MGFFFDFFYFRLKREQKFNFQNTTNLRSLNAEERILNVLLFFTFVQYNSHETSAVNDRNEKFRWAT